MQQINEFFPSKATQTLYHYTGVSSLMGMKESNCLWASSAYYLNDAKEITHACEVLESVLRPRFIFGDMKESENIFLKEFQAWINEFKNPGFNVFVFSLSEESNSLSQWRSYTPHGKGVSIGFSPERLNTITKNSNSILAKCIYDKATQENVMKGLVNKMLNKFRLDFPMENTPKSSPPRLPYSFFFEKFQSEILQTLVIIKDSAFEEEREWRLISRCYPNIPNVPEPEIKFREGASMITPYIELKFGESKPVFENIILGPSPHQELSMYALGMFLKGTELSDYYENCCIPYRKW